MQSAPPACSELPNAFTSSESADADNHDSDEDADERQLLGVQDGLLAKPCQGMEDSENAVEHSSIRPMWLLKFFMGWGAMWTARTAAAAAAVKASSSSPDPPGKDAGMGTHEHHRQRRSDDDETMVDEDESRKDR